MQLNTGKNKGILLIEEPGLTADRHTHTVKNRLLKVDSNNMGPGRID